MKQMLQFVSEALRLQPVLRVFKRNIQQHSWIVQKTKQRQSRGGNGGCMLSTSPTNYLCLLIKLHQFNEHYFINSLEASKNELTEANLRIQIQDSILFISHEIATSKFTRPQNIQSSIVTHTHLLLMLKSWHGTVMYRYWEYRKYTVNTIYCTNSTKWSQ